MRLALYAALLVLAPQGARGAGFKDTDVGTSSAQFLKLGADARTTAMGQAGRAVAEDANAVYWNPAGLAALTHRHVTMTHGALYQGVFYEYLAYAQPIRSRASGRRERELRADQFGAWGAALLYLNAGQISELDNAGLGTGESYTPQDVAFIAGWGMPINRVLDLGVSGKYISSRIKGNSSTGAFDLGGRLRLRFLFDLPWVVSAGVYNLGGRLKFIEEESPLPLTIAVGNSLRLTKNWLVAVDVVAPKDAAPHPALGTEYRFVYDADLSGMLRLGYNRRASGGDLDGLTGLTAGGGFGVGRFGFDYAWAPFGALGDTHRLSLNYRF